CGYHAVPFPLVETMVARTLLAKEHVLDSPVILTRGARASEKIISQHTPLARTAGVGIIDIEGDLFYFPMIKAQLNGEEASNSLSAIIEVANNSVKPLGKSPVPLLHVIAALRAADMAGAIARMLEITISYSKEQEQFGRQISNFQAVQQQIAILA